MTQYATILEEVLALRSENKHLRDDIRSFMAQLIVEQNGATLNGNVTIRQQPMPASVYDKLLAHASATGEKQ